MRVLTPTLLFSGFLALACTGGPAQPGDEPAGAATVDAEPPPPEPEPKAEEPKTAWMVIGDSSSDKARAQAMFDDYKAKKYPSHGDYPKFTESTGIDGLKPNFWLVVVAMAPTQELADEIEKKLELRGLSGAYVREVKVLPSEIDTNLDVDELFPPQLHVARFVSEEDTCVWQLIDPLNGAEVVRELARIPQKCSEYGDYQLAIGPKARAIVEMDGVWLVDLAAGKVSAIKPPEGSLDGVGLGRDGTVVAYSTAGDFKDAMSEEGPTGWFEYKGKRIEIDGYYPDSPIGYDLCHSWTLDGETWTEVRAYPMEGAEGTMPPFCPGWDDSGLVAHAPSMPWRIDPHGTMLSTHFEEGEQPAQLVKQSEYDEFGKVQDCGLTMGMGVQWLEGESYSLPVVIQQGSAWKKLEGMPDSGSFDWACRGEYMLACGGGKAGVYKSGTGKAFWTDNSKLCPIWWD